LKSISPKVGATHQLQSKPLLVKLINLVFKHRRTSWYFALSFCRCRTLSPQKVLRRISTTICNFYSKIQSESQTVGQAGVFAHLSREVERYFKSVYMPSFVAESDRHQVSKQRKVQLAHANESTAAAKKAKSLYSSLRFSVDPISALLYY
jgi:hypothetical protein